MDPNTSQTKKQFPLSKKKIIKKCVLNIFGALVAAVLFTTLGYYLATNVFSLSGVSQYSWILYSSMTVIMFLLLISVVIDVLYQIWYFKVYFYDFTPDYVVIRKGPITPREIAIPYQRIQDVYVDQDLLDRFLGLYDVHLSSATISSGMEAHIDGVAKASADGLKASILSTVSKKLAKSISNREVNESTSQ